MDAPTISYATAGIALGVSGALKPHHHDKVESLSVALRRLRETHMQLELQVMYNNRWNVVTGQFDKEIGDQNHAALWEVIK
jgi:hypothetical protein